MVLWTTALFAVTQSSHGLGLNTAYALFLDRVGVEFLPTMILLTGVVVMVTTLAFAAGLGRFASRVWLLTALIALGAVVILERVGIAAGTPLIYEVIWLGGQVTMMVSLTAMWTAAAEVCTTRQAKRLYPLFASAGIAGGAIGNFLTGSLANGLGTENVLLVQAALLITAGILAYTIGTRFFRSKTATGSASVIEDFRSGLRETIASPFLRIVAMVGVAFGGLLYLVDFPFSKAVDTSFETDAQIAGFLGVFYAIATVTTFVVSLLITNRLFARLGVIITLIIVPAAYLGGFGMWLVSFGLVTAAIFRGMQFVTVNAIGSTAWSSLFNVLTRRRRGQVLAFMTAGPMQLGTTLAGVLLLVVTLLPRQTGFSIALIVAIATVVLVWRMRGAYSDALVHAVKMGLVDLFTIPTTGIQKPVLDADSLEAFTNQLNDERSAARVVAVAMLGRINDARAERLIHQALADRDPRVRAAALDVVSQYEELPENCFELLADPSPELRLKVLEMMRQRGVPLPPGNEHLLEDPSPQVRGMAAAVAGGEEAEAVVRSLLGSNDESEIVAGLEAAVLRPVQATPDLAHFLEHPSQRVRAAAASAVVSLTGRAGEVGSLLDDPSVLTRRAAARALATSPEGVGHLLKVLDEGSVVASEAALRALTERNDGVYELDEFALRVIARARFLRRHRQALERQASLSSTLAYLCSVMQAREKREEQWAVMALTTTETKGAMGTVARGMWDEDEETRSQALEALESLADRSVVRELSDLLEEDQVHELADPTTSLAELTEDFDDWIRALAYRCLGEELSAKLERLHTVAEEDSSPLVRVALSRWDAPEMQQTETLDLMDRVLAIQKVPMFSDVDPEDLERIAAATTERHYEADEVIFREGDHGDEMLLIIRGEVNVSRERNGETEYIRTYGPGNHVGELALLRRRPRASDVIAGAEGVHTLVLRNPELHSILEERPAVAMSMLGTLAERIATL